MPDEISGAANEHATRVREMFATIASRYDLLNHLLSFNIDKRWRRLVASAIAADLPPRSAKVLDVACGTGDLALTLFETTGAQVIGSDFCRPMLDIAAQKVTTRGTVVPLVEGDALQLPFLTGAFDAVTIAFGLRNLANTELGLRELLRVLKPGGRLAVLEFSQPVVPGFRAVFRFYFTKLLPWIGGLVSGARGAYQYLPNSVARFPDQKQLAELMNQVGFVEVGYRNLTGGVAALHIGRKPN